MDDSEQREREARVQTRMAGVDRRQQILEVAAKLFSTKGFRGTTTKEIALAAGVNEAIIFRHFATKGELYRAIIDWKSLSEDWAALERALEKAEGEDRDDELFEEIAWRILEFHEEDDQALRLLMYSALEGHELSEIFFRCQISPVIRMVAEFIGRRVEAGVYRRVDPMTAVRAFVGMVNYHALTKKMYPRLSQELLDIDNREAARRYTEIFLASMLCREWRGGSDNQSRKEQEG